MRLNADPPRPIDERAALVTDDQMPLDFRRCLGERSHQVEKATLRPPQLDFLIEEHDTTNCAGGGHCEILGPDRIRMRLALN
jgi:hypothetical protein